MLGRRLVAVLSIAVMLIVLTSASVGPLPEPALSSECCCSWGDTIMQNTNIQGLIKEGEAQRICFLGTAKWINGVSPDVCVYAIWRIHCEGQDMQGYIELARIRDGVYWMEIYHSWGKDRLSVDMPYDCEVMKESQHFLKLNITTNF